VFAGRSGLSRDCEDTRRVQIASRNETFSDLVYVYGFVRRVASGQCTKQSPETSGV
jgi:hypothetical protein